ncbi:follicle-stimulating hormone receptor-like [Pollicipes pollicipes]|uniref:follicle-stimulating hormone receptor-like n=1 Tax=Pollicipes pollicipes TaxID=41117 RepID=UPI0018850A8A|nr:follicle-stimulating hormone receptor-like [Pollicipes pollicipes]
MKNNYLQEVDDEAFAGLSLLSALELEGNLLTDIPKAIGRLTAVQSIQLSSNKLTYVRDGVLQRTPSLEKLELRGNPILTVGKDAFSNLPRLKELELLGVKELATFPNLNGTYQLLDLRIYGSQLTVIPDDLCSIAPGLRRIYLPSNRLKSLPKLEQCTELRLLDVSYNAIESVSGQLFRSQYHMHDLVLRHNRVQELPGDTFIGLTRLLILDLRHNEVASIAEDAFVPLVRLQRLNLNSNRFPRLPHRGLEHLLHLHCSNIAELREFPEPKQLPQLHSVEVSYAYHCCQFRGLKAPRNETLSQVQERVIFPSGDQLDFSAWSENFTDTWPEFPNLSDTLGELGKTLLRDFEMSPPADESDSGHADSDEPLLFVSGGGGDLKCSPAPSPFMPCEDLFDWWTLRCGVWVVFLLALLGNGTVVFVLIFARSKMDVPRFLVCNLAAADFFMGVYLGFLAVVDASTLGKFRKYAIAWQMSAGCQMAGFLGVLSSELSVYTLAVITMERNYAITHAMHLNKRLSIKHASYIMACGWTFALVMALLPLVGVSDYRRFAVCLPFQTAGAGTGYVVFLMFVNGLAFTILMGCYWKMYCAIRGSQAWNSNDSRIAKRMALLVFTDFLCWAPIAFFAVTAAFGVRLIGLSGAKVFTVFILPFNSCCNPFLYAIMTKQFKKDCVMICKAIEESRVTRGIGRCRHSSNFSNRHTPANTNSLADRASKESKESAQCSCSQRLLCDTAKAPPPSRWATFRALWCPTPAKEQMDSSNDYAYQIAEIQKNQEKNKRNASLSSDNFSSSRSDSLRQQNGAHSHPPSRRRNSWTVTRKPSQDSNLSSSRNDSSATAGSNTTQSWRLSRSSVSSDMSSSALLRGQGSLHKPALAEAVERAGSLRGRPLRPAVVRQNSGIVLAHPLPHPLLKQASSGILKPKPKLTRQIAFSDEAAQAAAAAGAGTLTPGRHHESGCPLHCADPPPPQRHTRFHNVYSKLTESSQEESSGVDDGMAQDDSEGGAVGGAVGGMLGGGGGGASSVPVQVKVEGRKVGLTVAFVPRKLSTISSQSYSLQQDSHSNLSQVCAEPGPVNSLAAPSAGAIEKAHSAGDVRTPPARPRGFSSDSCILRRAEVAMAAGCLTGDEGFDDIDDFDEEEGASASARREQSVPLLREARPSTPATPRSSPSPTVDA